MNEKQPKTDENDFEALDRLARGITPEKLRPLTPQQRRRWEAAKRGRPRKAPGTKAVPTLITVEPLLLRRVDAYAKKAGVSRSQLFSDAIRRRIEVVD
ncbi:MAG TPA: ribbon-helix-helix protein, CopG family [Humisphaera sp.]|nr:ribbon-helix-helix protein, CopG family [Humisphaera sp.]